MTPDVSAALGDYLAAQMNMNHPAIPTQNFWANVLQAEQMQPSDEQQLIRQGDYIAPKDYQDAASIPSASVPGTSDPMPSKRNNPMTAAMLGGDKITNLSPDEINQMLQALKAIRSK